MQVTTARYRSPIADRLNLRYAPLDAEVVCTNAVLEAVRHEAAEARSRLAHGGLEIGGLLLGRRTDRSLEILGSLPIECEHKLGPLFILSAADEKVLDTNLAGDKLGSLQPVGLYVSHSRRDFAVAETEAKILDRLPAGPWQLVLVVMPAKFGPARAGFFIRGAVDRSFVCAHEVLLSPREHRLQPAVTSAPMAPITPIVADPNPVNRKPTALQRLRCSLPQIPRHWRLSQWNMATTLGLLLLFVSAGALWVRVRAVSSPAVPMHVSDLGTNLRIEWDPALKAVRSASRATLLIRDGESKAVTVPITRNELNNGGVVFTPHSDNIEVRLKLMQGSTLSSESVLYFINPERRVARPPAAAVSAPPVAAKVSPTPASPAPPVAQTPASPTPPVAQTPLSVAELRPDPAVQQVVEKRPPPDPTPDVEKPAKTFHLPAVTAPHETASIAPLDLPDLPDVHVSSPVIPVATSSPLVAVLARTTHLAGPPLLRSGRLIWTGALRKNASITITPAGASAGVLSGSLPGLPVKVSLQPAELVEGGIAVYSKDPEPSDAEQPPGAWNGWKVVVYDWDPKRIAAVDIVEAPGPANSWKRLVLRNESRNVSVFVVNWQRVAGQ
ncbi:MAG TPA: hypothetical protein VK776_15645 [Bryobacteraceae bacterium]|nr:hypothetical protein [Bryobacteraceae bacterium]